LKAVYEEVHRGMKLSIVIVNYNVKHFLEQCLSSVRRAIEGIDADVWVVDNNSVDGSVRMVREKFPEVKVIANKENLGFSRANNQAIRESEGEYVLLLNPDTVVEDDTFSKIISFMDDHPEAGGLGVKMLTGKEISFLNRNGDCPLRMLLFIRYPVFPASSRVPGHSASITWATSTKIRSTKWKSFQVPLCSCDVKHSKRRAYLTKSSSCTGKTSTCRTE
jgi:GT2 family glycosyltransferase